MSYKGSNLLIGGDIKLHKNYGSEQCGPGQHLSEVPISQQWATDRLWGYRVWHYLTLTLKHGPVLTREGRKQNTVSSTPLENLLAAFPPSSATLWPQNFREMKSTCYSPKPWRTKGTLSPISTTIKVMWGGFQVFCTSLKTLESNIHPSNSFRILTTGQTLCWTLRLLKMKNSPFYQTM